MKKTGTVHLHCKCCILGLQHFTIFLKVTLFEKVKETDKKN
jgi:hypothetical protein